MYYHNLKFAIIFVVTVTTFSVCNSFAQDKSQDTLFKSDYGSVYAGYGYDKDSTNMKFINFGINIFHPIYYFEHSFLDISTNIGFDGAKKSYLLNITPGWRIPIGTNFGLWMYLDIGVGVSSIKMPYIDNAKAGLNGLSRIGIGYNNWTVEVNQQILLSSVKNFNIVGLNFRYSFDVK